MAKSKSIVSKENETHEMFEHMLNKEIVKKSNRPFKSGEKIGVPLKFTTNEYSGRIAFVMKDDDSIVDCFRCKLLEVEE